MNHKKLWVTLAASSIIIAGCSNGSNNGNNDNKDTNKSEQTANQKNKVAYPKDGVKGIYVTSNSTQGEKIDQLIKYVKDAKLNAMVIDVKDDEGNVTMKFNTGNKLIDKNTMDIAEAKPLLKKLKDNDIYPIARIVTFKDTKLAKEHPEWSFKEKDGSVWKNGKGESFVNPFVKDVWKYNVNISKAAAKPDSKIFNMIMLDSLKVLKMKQIN